MGVVIRGQGLGRWYLEAKRFLLGLYNTIDFPLRQIVRLRRPGLHIRNEPKGNLFATLAPGERDRAEAIAGRLARQYHLERLAGDSTAGNYRENLFYLEMLERACAAPGARFPDAVRAADIGPSHWFYVQALYALLRWWDSPAGREVCLEGYEVDAYRVYSDFRSRFDHAQAHLRGLEGARYLPEPFCRQAGAYDFITMLFPFVFVQDHLNWGLPKGLWRPGSLLAEAWASLKPGGLLVVANQGEDEHRAQREMLERSGIPVSAAFRHDSLLFQYEIPRWVLVSLRS
jgi:SAM-dependent methyltransferase